MDVVGSVESLVAEVGDDDDHVDGEADNDEEGDGDQARVCQHLICCLVDGCPGVQQCVVVSDIHDGDV